MAVVITRTRHVRLGGTPLMTPAWHVTSLAALDAGPSSRGADVSVPYMMGNSPRRRWVGPWRFPLPITIFGEYDREGVAHSSVEEGLEANLDTLKTFLRPRQHTAGMSFGYYLTDGTSRLAENCSVQWPLQISRRTGSFIKAVIDVTVPGGVLRSPDPEVEVLPVGTTVLNNPGTSDQFEVVLEATGPFTIENEDWPATLEYTGSPDVTINTGTFRALHDDDTTAISEIEHAGHETWFPLLTGDNTLTVTGHAVTLTHYPPWL